MPNRHYMITLQSVEVRYSVFDLRIGIRLKFVINLKDIDSLR